MDLMRNSYFSSSLQLLPRILVTPTAPFIGTMSQNHYIVGLYLQATSVTHKVTAWTVSSLGTLKMFLTDTFLLLSGPPTLWVTAFLWAANPLVSFSFRLYPPQLHNPLAAPDLAPRDPLGNWEFLIILDIAPHPALGPLLASTPALRFHRQRELRRTLLQCRYHTWKLHPSTSPSPIIQHAKVTLGGFTKPVPSLDVLSFYLLVLETQYPLSYSPHPVSTASEFHFALGLLVPCPASSSKLFHKMASGYFQNAVDLLNPLL